MLVRPVISALMSFLPPAYPEQSAPTRPACRLDTSLWQRLTATGFGSTPSLLTFAPWVFTSTSFAQDLHNTTTHLPQPDSPSMMMTGLTAWIAGHFFYIAKKAYQFHKIHSTTVFVEPRSTSAIAQPQPQQPSIDYLAHDLNEDCHRQGVRAIDLALYDENIAAILARFTDLTENLEWLNVSLSHLENKDPQLAFTTLIRKAQCTPEVAVGDLCLSRITSYCDTDKTSPMTKKIAALMARIAKKAMNPQIRLSALQRVLPYLDHQTALAVFDDCMQSEKDFKVAQDMVLFMAENKTPGLFESLAHLFTTHPYANVRSAAFNSMKRLNPAATIRFCLKAALEQPDFDERVRLANLICDISHPNVEPALQKIADETCRQIRATEGTLSIHENFAREIFRGLRIMASATRQLTAQFPGEPDEPADWAS